MTLQDRYDEAMFLYSQGDFDSALGGLRAILALDPSCFDAQLALAMCFYRKGDYSAAIAEGHKAEALNPREQLVHTNLSLFYMKAGDKTKAEHHVARARMASWREALSQPPADASSADTDPTSSAASSPSNS